jgi:diguanylate cyclase (GGDEF)-like protein/PAS domain S-box-containing protein
MNGSFDARSANILVVDDTLANLGVIVDQLEEQGYQVAVAQDGEEAIRRAQRIRPDLILLDVMLPGIDGFETCRRLKTSELTRDTPVVFMTALTDSADKIKGFAAGGVDYVTKPFEAQEVLARVKTHLSLHAMQRAIAEQNRQLQHEVVVRQEAEEALRDSEARYRTLVESSPDAIMIEQEGRIVFANGAAARLFGADRPEALLGRALLTLVAPSHRAEAARAMQDLAQGTESHVVEEQALRLDESTVDVAVTRLPFHYQGRPAIQVVARDISESKRLQTQLKHLATHDALTGLPNRVLLMDRLSQALAYARHNHQRFMVALIDLDRFKWVNDSMGHEAGDQLLRVVSERILACMRQSDTVARIGGDEFVVLFQNYELVEQAVAALNRVVSRVSEPVLMDSGREIDISCSVGCSSYPDDGLDSEDLLRAADAAMYQAKQSGRNNLQIFNAELRGRVEQRACLEADLRHALERDEFFLHYQPKIQLSSGTIVGVEALLRWKHPTRGIVSPARFIPVAEETGVIVPIGEWVLLHACLRNKAWQAEGSRQVRVAVNLSAKQLGRPGLLEMLKGCLEVSGLAPEFLELELTESTSMDSPEMTIPLLRRIKDLGVSLAIDDFGTGYSNLQYLTRLPIDRIKLDGSFVRDITSNPGQRAIVEATIVMAHRLDIRVVAEMAETEGQVALLRELGCDEVQGHFFARAMPAQECAALLRKEGFSLPGPVSRGGDQRAVLVLGKDSEVPAALERMLRDEGYRVLCASTADEAFELLACQLVDAVLCEQRMPGCTGVEFLSAVRRLYPNTVRLILSDHGDFEAAVGAINRGAVHKLIARPWSDEALRDTLSTVFGSVMDLEDGDTRGVLL